MKGVKWVEPGFNPLLWCPCERGIYVTPLIYSSCVPSLLLPLHMSTAGSVVCRFNPYCYSISLISYYHYLFLFHHSDSTSLPVSPTSTAVSSTSLRTPTPTPGELCTSCAASSYVGGVQNSAYGACQYKRPNLKLGVTRFQKVPIPSRWC